MSAISAGCAVFFLAIKLLAHTSDLGYGCWLALLFGIAALVLTLVNPPPRQMRAAVTTGTTSAAAPTAALVHPSACPSCGVTVGEGDRFCTSCGAGLTAQRIAIRSATAGSGLAPRETNGMAIASLVLGILFLGGVGSLLAIIFANSGKRRDPRVWRCAGRRGSGDGRSSCSGSSAWSALCCSGSPSSAYSSPRAICRRTRHLGRASWPSRRLCELQRQALRGSGQLRWRLLTSRTSRRALTASGESLGCQERRRVRATAFCSGCGCQLAVDRCCLSPGAGVTAAQRALALPDGIGRSWSGGER